MHEHQVTIVLKLEHRAQRTPEARYRLHELARRLADAVERHATGRLDGQESSNSELRLVFHGPNADRLFNTLRSPLFASLRTRGGYAIKRHGPPGLGNKEERVDFDELIQAKIARAIKRRIKKPT
jgi:hypothetical protein